MLQMGTLGVISVKTIELVGNDDERLVTALPLQEERTLLPGERPETIGVWRDHAPAALMVEAEKTLPLPKPSEDPSASLLQFFLEGNVEVGHFQSVV